MTFFQKLSRLMWAFLIAAAVWWIGPLIAIGVYRPLGWVVLRQCAVVLLLIWGCWPWLVMVWHRLGMGLRQVQSKPARPVQDGMASRFRDLDRQLKARWEKHARSPLAKWMGRLFNHHRQLLPWYMVMGPEGAGKTSWIMQTLLPQRNGHDHDVDVNFWFTHDAVWVDTPGCWLTVKGMTEADQTTWSKLLKGMRKLRSSGTVANGIVLCLDIQSILEFSLEQRKRFAENLRDRFMDTQERWFQVPRVYLLLTGLDKLPGSVEFLSRLDSQTWRHGIGFSIDKTRINSNSSADLNAHWLAAYENLEARIQDQLLLACAQLTHQRALDQLPFAQALASLRKPLMEVLHTALMSVNGDLHGELRGVWLGSVADCTSQDFISSQTAELDEIPIKQSLSLLWRPAQAQILMEQAGVGEAKPVGLKNRLMASMRSIVWSLIAIALSLWLIFGFVAELNHLSQVEAQFAEGKRLANLHKLKERGSESPLLDVASQMRYSQLRVGDLGLSSVSPFFEHSRIQAVASQTYSRHLQKSFMPELHNLVQKTLQSQVRGGPGDIYQTLKIYLMLARPERRSANELEHWINAQWGELTAGRGGSDQDKRVLVSHARALFEGGVMPATPENQDLVRSARARASEIPAITRVLQHIQDQGLPSSAPEVSLARAAGLASSTALRLRSNLPSTEVSVPGWYTRSGYIDVFLPRLNQSARTVLEEESWVLRDSVLKGNAFEIDKAIEKLADSSRNQFLQDYIKRWKHFLSDVAPRHLTGLDDASQLASVLTDPQSPLALLVRFAARETTLTGNYDGDVDSWIDRQKLKIDKSKRAIVGEISGEHHRTQLRPEHAVEDQFDPLRRLALQMNQSDSNASGHPMSRLFEPLSRQLGLVNGAMQAGQVMPEFDAFTRLRNETSRQPEPIRGVMLDLINSGSSMTAKQSSAMLTRGAAGATKMVCDQGMASRYPFVRNSKVDAAVMDFERLFGAQGLMATHFREQLASYVDTSNLPWRARPVQTGASQMISDDIVRSYEVADRIRAATLDSAGQLRVSSIIRFVDMDPQLMEVQLDVAGQSMRYAHGGSAPRRVDWQAQGGGLSVVMSLRDSEGRTEHMRFDGPWALFRFFDAGRTSGGSAEHRETVHHTRFGRVRMEWQAVTMPSPIWSNLFSSFQCPR